MRTSWTNLCIKKINLQHVEDKLEEGRSGMDSCTVENGARILNYGIRKGEKTGNGR